MSTFLFAFFVVAWFACGFAGLSLARAGWHSYFGDYRGIGAFVQIYTVLVGPAGFLAGLLYYLARRS